MTNKYITALVVFSVSILTIGVPKAFAGIANAIAMLANYTYGPANIAAFFYNILFPVGIAFGIFGIAMAGYTYLTSEGKPEKVKDASDKLTSAILGVLFIALSMVILRVIIKSLLDSSVTF